MDRYDDVAMFGAHLGAGSIAHFGGKEGELAIRISCSMRDIVSPRLVILLLDGVCALDIVFGGFSHNI